MTIEEEIFKKSKPVEKKLIKYGFKKEDIGYIYSRNIMNGDFRVDVRVVEDKVEAKVIDNAFGDEYTNYRIEESTGAFVGQVREELDLLLRDIKKHCFESSNFTFFQTNEIANCILEKYGDEVEFPWEDEANGDAGIFRNPDSQKWYGIIMPIDKSKIEDKASGLVEVMNIKLDPQEIDELVKEDGFYRAYHMNKKYWITIILDGTVKTDRIMKLVEESHSYTETRKKTEEWIIPANPKYFDICSRFDNSDINNWKQGAGVKKGDIVYMYVGAPNSALMYKCQVLETDIPYETKNKHVKLSSIMKLKVLYRFGSKSIPFSRMKELGVTAVRGPRYMTEDLKKEVDKIIK